MKTQENICRGVKVNNTIKVKENINEIFHLALGVSEYDLDKLSNERLDKLSAGYFLADYNPISNSFRNLGRSFRNKVIV